MAAADDALIEPSWLSTSAGPLEVINKEPQQALSPYVRVLADELDEQNSLNAQQALTQLRALPLNHQPQLAFNISDTHYWLHVVLDNPCEDAIERILSLDYSLIRIAELYRIKDDNPLLVDSIHLSESVFERSIAYRHPSFELQIPPGQGHEYLIKLQYAGKANHALETRPQLYSVGAFIQYQLGIHLVFAGFIGFLLSIAIYNAILYLRVGISGHFYYSLYLIAYIFIVLFYEGLIFYLPQPPPASWVVAGMTLTPIYASLCLIAFGRNILQLNQVNPKLDRFYKWVGVSVLMLSPLTFAQIGALNLTLELTVVLLTFSLGIVSAYRHRHGDKAAKFFAISFVFIALGYGIETTLYSVANLSWFDGPHWISVISWVEQYFFYSCATIEMIFLSLALASYIEQLREDKLSAQSDALRQLTETNHIKHAYTEQLEAEIAERTREVTAQSELLSKKNSELVAIDKLKSDFFANISHEFRTPLTLIRGPLQQMQDGSHGELTPALESLLNLSSRNVERLSRLIEELLMLSQLESGDGKLQADQYDINTFCKRIGSLFQHRSQERGIDFSIRCLPLPTMVYFDQEKLETALCNLLSNAFKYTQPGGSVSLCLTLPQTHHERGTDECITITVTDNGPGIPIDQQSHVFERFYRINSDNDRAIEGSGIGLALVKELIELHCGYVSLDSKQGQGSAFSIHLPLGCTHLSSQDLLSQNIAGANFQPVLNINQEKNEHTDDNAYLTATKTNIPSLEKPTLLLVEDNSEMRTFIAGHFHKHYHVIEVSNGREALDRLEKEPVDIVLSDIMMPSMDGLSMLEHIRQHDCWRHLPVMLLTARAADEDRILALRARADDYLPKPFDSEELLLRVRNLLERKAAEKERPPESGTDKSETNTSLKKLASADQVFLDKARRIVFDNLQDNDFDVSKLAQSLHISKPTLQRRLTKSMNTTPAIFMRNIRLEHAHHLIQQKTYRTMAEVAHAVGFNSPGYFAKLYKQANFQ